MSKQLYFVAFLFLLFFTVTETLLAQQATSNGASSTTASSTTPVIEVAPKKSKFGFLAVSAIEALADDVRDRGSKAAVSTVNAVGITYKTSEDEKWGLRQYFTYLNDSDKESKFEMANPTITYSKKIKSLFGSDEFSPVVWYYIPTSEKSKLEKSNGKIRFTSYINWTLNPKWTATYFVDPRQSLTPETGLGFSKTTWIHGASISYNLSDNVAFYQGLGSTHEWKTSSMTLGDESIDISTGMYITVGPVLFIPDVTNSVATRRGGQVSQQRTVASTLYLAEETIYSLSMLANF